MYTQADKDRIHCDKEKRRLPSSIEEPACEDANNAEESEHIADHDGLGLLPCLLIDLI